MANPHPRGIQMPWSMKHHRSGGMGGAHGTPREIVGHTGNMVRDYFQRRDDFIGTLDTVMWTAANVGTASASPVFSAAAGGQLSCVAGTTNPSASVFYGTNAIFVADDNPFLYIRAKLPASVASAWLEVGWTNIVTTKTTECVSALGADSGGATAPTVGNGLTNGAVLAWNTGYTLTTPALVGVGTSIAAAGTTVKNTAAVAYSPTAAKWVDIYIGTGVGYGYAEIYENDVFINQVAVASGPDTATLLFPFFAFGSLGTARTWAVDVVELFSERNTR